MKTNQPTDTGESGEEIPLSPGVYRVLYAFESEGSAEMSLGEGDLVRVVGSGGVGWARVERGWKLDAEDHHLRLNIDGMTPDKRETDEIGESG
jgi:hypothetical protein